MPPPLTTSEPPRSSPLQALEMNERAGGVRFSVHVRPKSSRWAILGVREGALEVALTVPPADGAANSRAAEAPGRARSTCGGATRRSSSAPAAAARSSRSTAEAPTFARDRLARGRADEGSRFEKWEGLGNDFVVIARRLALADELVRRLCDRRCGVGADGVLVGRRRPAGRAADDRAATPTAPAPRCAATGCAASAGAPRSSDHALDGAREIVTDAGERCEVRRARRRQATSTSPSPWASRPPRAGPRASRSAARDAPLPRDRRRQPARGHLRALRRRRHRSRSARSSRESRPAAPTSSFAALLGAAPGIEVIVWERGVGRTLACGTGAAPSPRRPARAGAPASATPMRVRAAGRRARDHRRAEHRDARMRGPARRVFAGEAVIG